MASEGPQQKLAAQEGDKLSGDVVSIGANGKPLVQISAAAAELVPTMQYGNVTIGPVIVKRWVEDNGDDGIKVDINKVQSICEEAVAEARQSVHDLIRQSTHGRYNG